MQSPLRKALLFGTMPESRDLPYEPSPKTETLGEHDLKRHGVFPPPESGQNHSGYIRWPEPKRLRRKFQVFFSRRFCKLIQIKSRIRAFVQKS